MRLLTATILILCATGCAATKYPGFEKVRIETQLPNAQCKYIVQEACPVEMAYEGCFNWYKKRATRYNANTVVLPLTTDALGDYYACEVSAP